MTLLVEGDQRTCSIKADTLDMRAVEFGFSKNVFYTSAYTRPDVVSGLLVNVMFRIVGGDGLYVKANKASLDIDNCSTSRPFESLEKKRK